jgi:DNA-binding PadR family transcriptional regulator
MHHRRPRRRIGVTKGMLRYISMRLMERRPMSGSELMDQIQEYTDWRPSPGSMYPLLARLEEEGAIRQLEDEDPTLKRFTVTDTGLKELEELKRFDAQFRSRNRSIRKIYWRLHRGMPEDVYDSLSLLLVGIEENYDRVAVDPEKTGLFKDILEDAAKRIAEI